MPRHGKQPTVYGWRGEVSAARKKKTYGVPVEYQWAFEYPVGWDEDLRPAPDISDVVARLNQGPWFVDHGLSAPPSDTKIVCDLLDGKLDWARDRYPEMYEAMFWRLLAVEDGGGDPLKALSRMAPSYKYEKAQRD